MTQDRLYSRQTGMTRWLMLVILILAGVIGAGGWLGWQEYQRLQADKADVVGQVETLKAAMAAQRSDVQGALAAFEKKQAELAAQRIKDRALLTDMKTGGQKLWLINEARALASLASQRLLLTQDAMAARRLLEAADNDLPALMTFRVAGSPGVGTGHGQTQPRDRWMCRAWCCSSAPCARQWRNWLCQWKKRRRSGTPLR